MMKNSLIVLDLDGLLIYRLPNKNYIVRPGLDEFISFCLFLGDIAFFSSMLRKNIIDILITLFSPYVRKKIKYIWDRNYTDVDPEKINEWDTIKSYDKVQKLTNYMYKKIIMCDDDYRKLRFNPIDSYIIVQPFKGEKNDDHLQKLKEKIIKKYNEQFGKEHQNINR